MSSYSIVGAARFGTFWRKWLGVLHFIGYQDYDIFRLNWFTWLEGEIKYYSHIKTELNCDNRIQNLTTNQMLRGLDDI